jgi:hypothetical protein
MTKAPKTAKAPKAPKLGLILSAKRTHEAYVRDVYQTALVWAFETRQITAAERDKLANVKLTYGGSPDGARGVTYYSRWVAPCGCPAAAHKAACKASKVAAPAVPLLAISGVFQRSLVQVCGTTLHEMGHVLAGHEAAHMPAWREACAKVGLTATQSGGQQYEPGHFAPALWARLDALAKPDDGAPTPLPAVGTIVPGIGTITRKMVLGICTAGMGSKGGTSRGAGSGSRLVLWVCDCDAPAKVRASQGSGLDATCNKCGAKLRVDGESVPFASGGVPKAPSGVPAAVRKAAKAAAVAQGLAKAPKAKARRKPGKAETAAIVGAVHGPVVTKAKRVTKLKAKATATEPPKSGSGPDPDIPF